MMSDSAVTEKTLTVRYSQVDRCRRMRPSAFLNLMAEDTMEALNALGFGDRSMPGSNAVWVVVKNYIRWERVPELYDTLRMESWFGASRKVLFPRRFRFTDENGRPVAEACSLWALMDGTDRHFLFPASLGVDIPGIAEEPRFLIPPLAAPKKTDWTERMHIPASFIDLNGHLGNARYPDLAEDFLPESLRERPLRSMNIIYSAEVPAGLELDLSAAMGADRILFSGDSDKHHFLLELSY